MGSGRYAGRGRQFTHSKVIAWVAVDRAIKTAERFGLEAPILHWRRLRAAIHAEVCHEGFDSRRNSFVQYYGGKDLDASLLMIALVGFLPATDPPRPGTVEAIQRHLMRDGLVARYLTAPAVDGLPPGESAFLACTFWLADNLALLGRHPDARRLFERLLACRNDVGLLPGTVRSRGGPPDGQFPSGLPHVSLVNTACNLLPNAGPAEHWPHD